VESLRPTRPSPKSLTRPPCANVQLLQNAECQRSLSRTLKLARSEPRTQAAARLPYDSHFSRSLLANANRLSPVFEFPPTPVPINHRHEAVKCGRNRLRVTVLYPDTQSRLMFAFIDAGGWFAHFIRSLRALPAGPDAPLMSSVTGFAKRLHTRTRRNSEPKHLAKITQHLEDGIPAIKTTWLPDMRKVLHNLCETQAFRIYPVLLLCTTKCRRLH
jgi:hypothetical protein